MKTKLTLTISKHVIESAKRTAKSKGMSLSQMFEDIFQDGGSNQIKTERQKAAERLLQKLEDSKSIQQKDDKELVKAHVERKFA